MSQVMAAERFESSSTIESILDYAELDRRKKIYLKSRNYHTLMDTLDASVAPVLQAPSNLARATARKAMIKPHLNPKFITNDCLYILHRLFESDMSEPELVTHGLTVLGNIVDMYFPPRHRFRKGPKVGTAFLSPRISPKSNPCSETCSNCLCSRSASSKSWSSTARCLGWLWRSFSPISSQSEG